MRWYVFSTATHKLEKILENPASYSDPAGSIKNGLCPPTVPFMIPHGVYTEKNNIYMYIGYKSGACDFVKLDTTTDTFTTIQRPSLNIQRELFLPKNSSSVYQVRGFGKYGDNYFN